MQPFFSLPTLPPAPNCTSGSWCVATPRCVVTHPLPILSAGEYQEALALAALVGTDADIEESIPAEQSQQGSSNKSQDKAQADSIVRPEEALSDPRLELEDRLRLLYGHHLFNSGEYEEGLAQLTLVSSHFLEGLRKQGDTAGSTVSDKESSTTNTIPGKGSDTSSTGQQYTAGFGSQELGRALLLLRMVPGLVPSKFQGMLPTHAGTMQLPKVRPYLADMYEVASAYA
jgi:hypothetical protein